MSNKLYTLRLAPGFPAESRTRGGISLTRGERLTVELTAEQLKAVKADEWITVKEADASVIAEDAELDFDVMKRKDLDLIAIELGLDPSDYSNLETLRPAVKEAHAKREAGDITPPAPETTPPKAPEAGSEDEGTPTDPNATETPITAQGEGEGAKTDTPETTVPNLDDKTVEELGEIAKELNIGVTLGEDEAANKALLIKVIQDAKPVEG